MNFFNLKFSFTFFYCFFFFNRFISRNKENLFEQPSLLKVNSIFLDGLPADSAHLTVNVTLITNDSGDASSQVTLGNFLSGVEYVNIHKGFVSGEELTLLALVIAIKDGLTRNFRLPLYIEGRAKVILYEE